MQKVRVKTCSVLHTKRRAIVLIIHALRKGRIDFCSVLINNFSHCLITNGFAI